MLFDPKPKRSLSDFFDMEEQLDRLKGLLGDPLVRLVVVKGLRRSGKTSLVLVSINSLGMPHVYIDCRSLEPISYSVFEKALISGFEKLYRSLGIRGRLGALLRRIREVGVAGVRVSFEERRSLIVEMLGSLPRDSGVALVLDEAQVLSPLRGVAELLAYIYDNVDQVKLVITGSEVGVLESFLKLSDPRSPLYGRPYGEVLTGKLGRAEALEFLRLGFREAGFKIRGSELAEAVDRLNGIIGWLTYYGWYTVRLGSHGEGLAETLRVGSRLVVDELRRFLVTRGVAWPRYVALLRSLAGAPRTWSEAKRALEGALGMGLANNQFTRYLKELERYGFVEKHGKYYKIVDPILEYALLSGEGGLGYA